MKQKRAAAAAGITNALERERTATAAGLAYVFEQHCGARHVGFPATRLADALEQEHVAVEPRHSKLWCFIHHGASHQNCLSDTQLPHLFTSSSLGSLGSEGNSGALPVFPARLSSTRACAASN